MLRKTALFSYLVTFVSLASTHEVPTLAPVDVHAQSENLTGVAATGSEGVVSGERLAATPLLRPGEALEMVPGLIVTQHAGDGKANQFFLRGFNLDHGTDFATFVGGVPVNMPTHAHGQGYSDLNFLIPELVEQVRFRKGPYFADEGDFASAGAARIDYRRTLDGTLGQVTIGENAYARSLAAGSSALGSGRLLYAFEWFHNDGPWQVPEEYRKLNGVLSYSQGGRSDGFSLTAMAYRGTWTSTDQVAKRALDNGILGRFGSLDPTSGGETRRLSLSGEWARRREYSQSRATVWWLRSGLDLWSNFQYCFNQGCPPGDQFKQSERRQAGGFDASQTVFGHWGARDVIVSVGLQGRIDHLQPVGLYDSRQRTTWNTVREDQVTEKSVSLWAQSETVWSPWLRTIAGLRGDAYRFAVESSLAANSGRTGDQMVTPKFSFVLGPWRRTELYLNIGQGFHSNDARGTTIHVAPNDGTTTAEPEKPLVRTRGYEAGLRSEPLPGWEATLALWQLDSASELLFVGDVGTTEPSRPSRRRGMEWTNHYHLGHWLAVDADLAWSHARFRNADSAGSYIPGALAATANLGVTLDDLGPWFGTLRLRYFGPRPLIADNSVRSMGSALTNLRLGYKFDKHTQVTADVYNLFDRKVNDIEYWYPSQLPGEAAPVFDRHLHPTDPRTVRLTVSHRF